MFVYDRIEIKKTFTLFVLLCCVVFVLDVASCHQQIGQVYVKKRLHQKAHEHFLQAVEIAQQLLGRAHPTTILFAQNMHQQF